MPQTPDQRKQHKLKWKQKLVDELGGKCNHCGFKVLEAFTI